MDIPVISLNYPLVGKDRKIEIEIELEVQICYRGQIIRNVDARQSATQALRKRKPFMPHTSPRSEISYFVGGEKWTAPKPNSDVH